MVKVWDPLVRLFHWSLVILVAMAWITADEIEAVHVWAGYGVAALVGFRLLWGAFGTRYARFAQFVPTPARLVGYLRAMLGRREPRYLGHNPAGAAMVLALLATLTVTVWTGWQMEGAPLPGGLAESTLVVPALADEDEEERDARESRAAAAPAWVEEVHEAAANLLLVLIALHVAGVIWASIHSRENLVRAMVTGRKRAPGPGDVS